MGLEMVLVSGLACSQKEQQSSGQSHSGSRFQPQWLLTVTMPQPTLSFSPSLFKCLILIFLPISSYFFRLLRPFITLNSHRSYCTSFAFAFPLSLPFSLASSLWTGLLFSPTCREWAPVWPLLAQKLFPVTLEAGSPS